MQKVITITSIVIVIMFALFYTLKSYLYYSTEHKLTFPTSLKLQDGDIILRKESNRISDIFAKINKSEFSHIGTILHKGDKSFVVHIEDLDDDKDFQVIEINSFIKYATAYSIYRPLEQKNEENLSPYVAKLEKQNLDFDLSFGNEKNTNSIYCTELAVQLYNKTHRTKLQTHKVHYLNYDFIPLEVFDSSKFFEQIFYFNSENML